MTSADVSEQTKRIFAAAEAMRAEGPSARRAARDPINMPMIRNWTEALGDTNPIYESDAAARAAGHPGVVAPPAMAQVWTMRGLGKTWSADDPLGRMTHLLDAEGFTSVVATNCDQTYHRYVQPGEEVTVDAVLTDVVGPKTTGLGEGYFFTTHSTWRVGEEVVAEMDFRILKFAPAAAGAGAPGARGVSPGAQGTSPSDKRVVSSLGADTSDLVPGTVLRPSVSHDTQFFWEGVRAHELRIQRRPDGTLQHPPVPALWKDKGEQTDYQVASGRGTVYSYVVHHAPRVPGRTRFPFVIALVELDEGVRMLGELRGIDPLDVHIGLPVQVEYLDMPGDTSEAAAPGTEPWTLYAFAPAADTARQPHPAERVTATAGQRLPELRITGTPTFIVSTALATRDFQDVHHDRDLAHAKGSKDIFVNILTDTGLVARYITDWAGQQARVRSVRLRLGVPWYAYDTLALSGTVESVAADGLVTCKVVGTDALGAHVTATVELYMDGETAGAARTDEGTN